MFKNNGEYKHTTMRVLRTVTQLPQLHIRHCLYTHLEGCCLQSGTYT